MDKCVTLKYIEEQEKEESPKVAKKDFWYYLSISNIDEVDKLLKQGFPVNEREEYLGETPLQIAIESGNLSLIELLLTAGADSNMPDDLDHLPLNYGGNTPLHYAVRKGDIEIVRLLLKFKADPQIADQDNQLPIDIARYERLDQIVELLNCI